MIKWLFAIVIFLGSFLLFEVQPIIGKYILPWFGGSSAIWMAALLFFQLALLIGYIYAHLLTRLSARMQSIIHIFIITTTCLWLLYVSTIWTTPITPAINISLVSGLPHALQVLYILMISIGLPYFILSATSSLLQYWYSRIKPDHSPYFFYVISNAASMLALLVYPFLLEPLLPLSLQAQWWTLLFFVYASGIVLSANVTLRFARPATSQINNPDLLPRPNHNLYLLWILLPCFASMLLMSTTNQLTQGMANIPFLWILPLSVYLLAFIISFSPVNLYNRKLTASASFISFMLVLLVLCTGNMFSFFLQSLIYCGFLFFGSLLCLGEIYWRRPAAEYLTIFYLCIAAGGALGGIFVGLIAPLIFNWYWEYYLSLFCCSILALNILRQGQLPKGIAAQSNYLIRAGKIALLLILVSTGLVMAKHLPQNTALSHRSFYGVVRVLKQPLIQDGTLYKMAHGKIIHGMQYTAAALKNRPTVYYSEASGVGLAIQHHPAFLSGQPLKIGAVGLGVGTISAYGRPQDYFRFYELDPAVVSAANKYFTYLTDCPSSKEIILGDGRLSMAQELQNNQAQNFDIIVIDAFSEGTIPVHLLTKEAFAVYLGHLEPRSGIIAVHISNRYFDFAPLIKNLSSSDDLYSCIIYAKGDNVMSLDSIWALLTYNKSLLEQPAIKDASFNDFASIKNIPAWTDDYSNILAIIR